MMNDVGDLLYVGVDEAGYGPMLGPLCVGRASFTIRDWEPNTLEGAPARVPDLWDMLISVIARTRKEAAGRITIADSKKLKLPSSSVRYHPLVHLERGVLTMLGTIGDLPTTDAELFQLLGVTIEDQPWFQEAPIELPVGNKMDVLKIESNQLRSEMHKAGVQLHEIKVEAMGVSEFNEVIYTHGTKAATTTKALLEHLHSIAKSSAHSTRIVIDRQSGRTHYHKLLSRVWDGIDILEESSRASRYSQGQELGVLLVSKADDAYFPVSLASMAAKLVRELMMERFNRYWCAKNPELKPTAGYVQDARRWLADMEDHVTREQQRSMIRNA